MIPNNVLIGKEVFVSELYGPSYRGVDPYYKAIELYSLPDERAERIPHNRVEKFHCCFVVDNEHSSVYLTIWPRNCFNGYFSESAAAKFNINKDTHIMWVVSYHRMYQTNPLPASFRHCVSKKDSSYPHVCPACKNSAYIGFSRIECTGINCKNFALKKMNP